MGSGGVKHATKRESQFHARWQKTLEFPESKREAIQAALALKSLSCFVRHMWPELEPGTDLLWNWHIELICSRLERVSSGKQRRLLINVPPGHMKSLLVSVFWPSWEWLTNPALRLLTVSGSDDVATRDSRKMRTLVTSSNYRKLVDVAVEAGLVEPWDLSKDQKEKVNFATSMRGERLASSIGARVTGKRGDVIIIDDPMDAKEATKGSAAQVEKRMKELRNNVDGVLSTRVNNPRTARMVMIMQRLHESDPSATWLEKDDVESVILPSRYDPERAHPLDPRTEVGELLFPEMYSEEVLQKLKRDIGARNYAAQFEQRPTPASGGTIQRGWVRRYMEDPQREILFEEMVLSVDATFKGQASNDRVSIQVWGRKGAGRYLCDEHTTHMTFTRTRKAILEMRQKWPRVMSLLIEEKANGAALIDDLGNSISGIVPFNPDPYGSKEARAQLAARFWESGNVYIPADPRFDEYVEEIVSFPGGRYADRVDAMSQVLIKWGRSDQRKNSLLDRLKKYAWMG